jgi:hypothetical protein
MSSGNEVASSYHSVPESLSEMLAGAYISSDDEPNRAEEVFPSQRLVDDTSSNDSFLDVSETSSMTDDNWRVTSPEQGKQSTCVWSCQKLGKLFHMFTIFKPHPKCAYHKNRN